MYIYVMFPKESEKARAKTIEENYKLFCGDFASVLKFHKTDQEKKSNIEVVQNVAGLVSRVFADLMFLKNPIITLAEPNQQELVDELITRNDLFEQFYESALSQSYAGRASFKHYMEDGKVFIEELNPSTLFPQYDSMSVRRKPGEVIVAYELKIAEDMYRYIERHTSGYITYELWMLDGDGNHKARANVSMLGMGLPEEPEYTGIEHIPVYWVDNHKTGREYAGFSDYADLRSIFTELSRVQSQIATQLKKHGNAKMAVPQGVLNEHGMVRNENLEMIEVSGVDETGGLVIPQYITNSNPQIEAAFKEQERLLEALARVAEVSSVLIDINVSGRAERVGALRLRMLRTLAKVERKLKPYERCIKQMLIDAIAWEHGVKIEHNDIDIKFRNGLPEDMLEKANIEAIRMSSGNQTVRDSVKNLDNLEGELLNDKLQALQEETVQRNNLVGAGVPNIQF